MSDSLNSALLDISRSILKYKTQYPDTPIQSPQFTLIGTQSSGKTSFLCVLAGRLIGGSIKSSAGTRCNIVYVFKNGTIEKFEVGTDLATLEEVDLSEVCQRITHHNDHIKDTVPLGFDNSNYYVRVTSPDAVDFSIIDKPGFIPSSNDPANECISNIFQMELTSHSLIPLIMIAPNTSMDDTFLEGTFDQIFTAIGSNVHVVRKAFVVVTHLDNFVNANAYYDSFVKTREYVQKKFERQYNFFLPPDRIFFVSLKPHHYDPRNIESFPIGHDKFVFAHENDLIKNAREYEKNFLPQFVLKVNQSDTLKSTLNFGVFNLIDSLNQEVLTHLKENKKIILKQIKEEGEVLSERVQNYLTPSKTNDSILRTVDSYVELVCAGLKAATSSSNQLFKDALERSDIVKHADGRFNVELADSLAMSFEVSRQCAELSKKNLIKFGDTEAIGKVDSGSELSNLLESPLSGSSDVERVLSMFRFYCMTCDLQTFTEADIYNKMRHIGTQNAILKMVEEHMGTFNLKDIVKWATDIYKRMLPQVLLFLSGPKIINQLAEYPLLLSYINEYLVQTFDNFFKQYREDALDCLDKIKQVNVSTLDVSKVEYLSQLVGNSNIGALKPLVEPLSELLPVLQIYKSKFLEAFDDVDLDEDDEEVKPSLEHGLSFEFVAAVTKCSSDAFALGWGINLLQFRSLRDVRLAVNEINEAVKALTRLTIGSTALTAGDIVTHYIVRPGDRIDDDMRTAMSTVKSQLKDNNCSKLMNLINDDKSRVRLFQQTIRQIELWMEIAIPLSGDSTILSTTITKLKLYMDKLIRKIEEDEEEVRRSTCNATIDIDPDAKSNDNANFLSVQTVLDNSNLRLNNIKLLEENKKLQEKLQDLKKSNKLEVEDLTFKLKSSESRELNLREMNEDYIRLKVNMEGKEESLKKDVNFLSHQRQEDIDTISKLNDTIGKLNKEVTRLTSNFTELVTSTGNEIKQLKVDLQCVKEAKEAAEIKFSELATSTGNETQQLKVELQRVKEAKETAEIKLKEALDKKEKGGD